MTRFRRLLDSVASALMIAGAIGLTLAVHLGGIHLTRVLSASMEPAYSPGDLVLLRAIDTHDLAVGEVPMLSDLTDPGARFVHRAISVTHRGQETDVVTRGDANPVSDTPVTITAAKVQVVMLVIPLSRVPVDALLEAAGLLLLAGAGTTLATRAIRSRVRR